MQCAFIPAGFETRTPLSFAAENAGCAHASARSLSIRACESGYPEIYPLLLRVWQGGTQSVKDCFVQEVRADGTVIWDEMGFG